MTSSHHTGILMKLRRFRANAAGVAMIEFAVIAPLLVVMALGTFEVGRSIVVHKRFQRAVAMVGDLVSRETSLGTTSAESQDALKGIMLAAEHVMWPYDVTPLKIAVMQIYAPASPNENSTIARWSFQHRSAPVTACGQPKAMPSEGMIPTGGAGGYAILVEAEYQYTSFIKNIVPFDWSTAPFKDVVANLPRDGPCVRHGGPCELSCP